ncbi:MAG: hypothetical protein WCA78_12205 [Rhizomicrobium sp.]
MNDDTILTVETYRGVRIHDQQSPERIDHVVKPAIDHVLALDDLDQLFDYAGDIHKPPEARLLAAAKCEVSFQIATDERRERPDIDLSRLRARVVGLNSRRCRDRWHFCSIYDTPPAPGTPRPDSRERPLNDEGSAASEG